ncbi:hypothetical protein NIES2100_14090 [Calothrix sp. NIES-2100]|uniref:DUF2283 domain-containing protein n=1 Tax=Calothrix sp. NIES-2100 TaxID=1954172 RepID=UPI000B5EF043|nr:hypothetical protein NIES2100_14090 [Calothrix sp. NIES-2100]
MSKPSIKYDETSDTLTVCFEPGSPATGIELTDHILLRINQQQCQAVSIAFFDYSVLAQKTEMGTRSFPLTGLSQISSDLKEIVFNILLTPPVSDFLQLSAYTVSLVETIPIISLQPILVEMTKASA